LTAPNVPRLARRTCSFDVLKSIVVPAQHHKLTGAQPMAVGEQDRGGVPVPPTVADLDQAATAHRRVNRAAEENPLDATTAD
jgi:hypothetical protein